MLVAPRRHRENCSKSELAAHSGVGRRNMKTQKTIVLFALVIVGFGCAGSGSVGRAIHQLPAALDHGRSGHCIESVDGELVLFGGWHDQEGSTAKKELESC